MNLKLITLLTLVALTTPVYAETQSTEGYTPMSQSIEKNKKEGEAYLKANATKPGVTTLSDGLQYKIIKPGTGDKPSATDTVVVDYTGAFINGKEFDSSSKHGGPATFGVNQVISGWTEALQLMPIGSVWEITIPAALAYGDQGAPPIIGPGETLVFKVKLIDIKK